MITFRQNLSFGASGIFVESNINQSNSNNSKKKNYLCLCNLRVKIHNCCSSSNSSALIANANDTIAANQPANKLEHDVENTFSCGDDSLKENFINNHFNTVGGANQ